MQKSYECEIASHIGPESCGAARKGGVEAKSERPLLPTRATAFREGHKKSSVGFEKLFWEETEKQKARRSRAREFGPRQCPETMSGRKRLAY